MQMRIENDLNFRDVIYKSLFLFQFKHIGVISSSTCVISHLFVSLVYLFLENIDGSHVCKHLNFPILH